MAVERATTAQRDYLEILLNQRGYSERVQRNAWLSAETGKEINYLDELTKSEASRLIDLLKETEDE